MFIKSKREKTAVLTLVGVDLSDSLCCLEEMVSVWLRSLKREGGEGNDHVCKVSRK